MTLEEKTRRLEARMRARTIPQLSEGKAGNSPKAVNACQQLVMMYVGSKLQDCT